MKTAEDFFREKAFPVGITDEKWNQWKHEHKGTNWVGFAIKAMEAYSEQESIDLLAWIDKEGYKRSPANNKWIHNYKNQDKFPHGMTDAVIYQFYKQSKTK